MTEYGRGTWLDEGFVGNYLTGADIFQVERRTMLSVLSSFYRFFIMGKAKRNILDIGCGDGIVAIELSNIDKDLTATLLDGSGEMLSRAKERFAGRDDIRFVKSMLQDIGSLKDAGGFDLIVSSMAIHHLDGGEKKGLFRQIYSLLNPGGYFINMDVVLCPDPKLERWAIELWRERIRERQRLAGSIEDYTHIPDTYKSLTENVPDTLDFQLGALRETGFQSVDCLYKYGIFTVYTGMR